MISNRLAAPRSAPTSHRMQPTRRPLLRGLVATGALALLAAGLGSSAMAAPGETDTDTIDANVVVESEITLTGLPTDFTLTGLPGDTVATVGGTVTYNVQTNNVGGYSITVESETPTLLSTLVANLDSIPIDALSVRESGTTTYTPLSDTVPVLVHTQAVRSDAAGDDLESDFSVDIPFVNTDTYTATLDYVATTL